MNFSINIVDNINSNSGVVTVDQKSPYRLTSSTEFGGFKGEQKIYNIKGSTSSKSRITIATIRIDANSGKRFIKSPSLNSKNNIKLILNSVDKTTSSSGHKYISSYLFNVVYYNTVSVSKQDGISADLVYNDSVIPTRGSGALNITTLTTGKSVLNRNHDRRNIKIFGAPKSTITFTINDEDGNCIIPQDPPDLFHFPTGQSKIDANKAINDMSYFYANTSTSDYMPTGSKPYNAHRCTIGSSGVYSFYLDFPSVTIRATKVNGSMAASGTDKIKFDDLTGVKIGDRLMLASSSDETTSSEVIALDPDDDDVNECTVSPNFTAADNAIVRFKRSREYYINIESSSGLGPNVPTSSPTYTWRQYRDPILTIKVTPGSDYKISHFNDVAISPTPSDGDPHEKKYSGKVLSTPGTRVDFSYLLDVGGGHTFTSFTTPIFSKNITRFYTTDTNDKSHWTNSVTIDNGGTDIDINNISSTAIGAQTLKISGTLTINKFGTKDVTMELNLDNITSNSR